MLYCWITTEIVNKLSTNKMTKKNVGKDMKRLKKKIKMILNCDKTSHNILSCNSLMERCASWYVKILKYFN